MAGNLTAFPYFSTNYPSSLVSLDEYVRRRYTDLAHMNEKWAAVEQSHRRVAGVGAGRFFEGQAGEGPGDRATPSLLPREWLAPTGRPSSAASARARPASAMAGVRGRAADADLAERQRDLLSSYPLASVGHTTTRLGARPSTAAAAPSSIMVDNDRDTLELDGRQLTEELDMVALLTTAPNAVILSLRRCTLSDDALRTLPRLCPHVTHMDLTDAKGFGVEALILTLAALPKLAGLRLGNCNHLFALHDSPDPRSEPLPHTALSTLQASLYPAGGSARLARSVYAALETVAALPPPPALRGSLEEAEAKLDTAGSGSPRRAMLRGRGEGSALRRAMTQDGVVEDGDALDDVAVLARRTVVGSRPPSAVVRPRSAYLRIARLLDDADAGVPLGVAHPRDTAVAARPGTALAAMQRRRPLSAYVRASGSAGTTGSAAPPPSTSSARGASAAGTALAAAPASSVGSRAIEVPHSEDAGADLTIAVAGKLLCHAIGAAPHQMAELSFSRCSSITDDMFIAVSGQSAGLLGADVFASSNELFHTAASAAAATTAASTSAAASWAARMSEAETRQAEAEAARHAQLEEVRRRMGLGRVASDGDASSHDGTGGAASDVALLSPSLGVQTTEGPRRGSADGSKIFAMYKPPVCDIPLGLQVLDLTACANLTDHALAFLGANCPNLAVLRLRFCDQPGISDAGIAAVASGCPDLLTLDVRGCAQLTSASVTALARHCHALQRVCLAGCTSMDDAAVGVLASSRAAATLLDLDLTRCKLVTGNAVKNLMFKAPALARPPGDGVLNLTLCAGLASAELDVLMRTFSSARIVCTALTETDASKPSLVPTFQAPPKDEAFASRRVFAVYSVGTAAGKAAKRKGR